MSANIIDKIQTQPFTDSDTAAYIRAVILCDTVADLPGVNDFTDYILTQGSTAHVISTAEDYQMQSDGTWSLHYDLNLSFIINSLSDIDSRLHAAESDSSYAKTQIDDFIYPALRAVINRGAKNALNLISAQSDTINGVTFTVNSDLSITISGTASATTFYSVPVTIPAGAYWYSGMPENGGTASYRLELRLMPGGSVSSSNDSEDGVSFVRNSDYTGYFSIRVASGYSFGSPVTVKPMISPKVLYDITQDYVPYSPTNAEIAQLIHSYHP